MAEQQIELASLLARLEQLEQEQTVVKKYVKGIKRELDKLTEQFNDRPELVRLESSEKEIADLQKRCDRLSNFISGDDDSKISDAVTNSATTRNTGDNLDDGDRTILNIERLDEQISQESIAPTVVAESHQSILQETAASDNDAETYQNEEIDAGKQEEKFSVFSDEEFQIERMLLLLMRDDTDEEESHEPGISAEEFLRRCKEGEKDFTGINLAGSDFSRQSISKEFNLSKANLSRAKLNKVNLSAVNLSGANLRGAELCEAELNSINLNDANLNNTDLRKAKMYEAKLGKANLRNANLNLVNLQRANLSEANLILANLSGADLSLQANLNDANLSQANL
ncbi:pentapeptide repeat-containing protein, partial [Planktothrix sp. FACHB-1355]